jgi:hypothetical protein
MTRDHQDRQAEVALAQRPGQGDPRDLKHLVVRHEQVERLGIGDGDRSHGVRSLSNRPSLAPVNARQEPPDERLVVDHERDESLVGSVLGLATGYVQVTLMVVDDSAAPSQVAVML